MKDIFDNAKFGDKFKDVAGMIYIYHYGEKHKGSDGQVWTYHYLIREPERYKHEIFNKYLEYHPYDSYVFKDGYGVPSNLKYYDIDKIKKGPNKNYLIITKL